MLCKCQILDELWWIWYGNEYDFFLFVFLNIFIHNRAQTQHVACNDLFKDRYLNLLWGRLACELLIGNLEDAQMDIHQIDSFLKSCDVSLLSFLFLLHRLQYQLLKLCKKELGYFIMVYSYFPAILKDLNYSFVCL